MPDILNASGLQTKSLNDLVTELEDGLKAIYGSDINVDSNSPDGQLINITSQAGIDIREFLTNIYNSFNPETATGAVLDQRVVINNIRRSGGTFTIVPIDVEVDQNIELQGLDAQFNEDSPTGDIYTIQDDSGNEFYLIDTHTFTTGTTTKNFRAKNRGNVEVTTGTIETQKTVVLGVVSVTNSSGVLEQGVDEETDVQLKIRRVASRANATFGYLNGLQGAILAISGVTDAKIYENKTDSVDGDSIPAHGIWAIVEGGANQDIAETIYEKLTPGTNMKGSVSVSITTPAGVGEPFKFDRPSSENLHIQFDIQTTESGASFNQSDIKDYIVANLSYSIGQFAETSEITSIAKNAINSLGGGGVPVNVEISDDGASWVDYLETSTKDNQFTLDTSRVTITVIS